MAAQEIELRRRLRYFKKYGAICSWMPRITSHLEHFGLEYDRFICLHAIIPTYVYIAYFMVKPTAEGPMRPFRTPGDLRYVLLNVSFDSKGKIIRSSLSFRCGERALHLIRELEASELVLDRRAEFNMT